MKRESRCTPVHHFSFGEPFDETLMKGYFICYQHIRLHNHQFIGFSPLIKSAVETAAPSLPVCPCADRQSCRHNGTEYHARLAKRKGEPMSADITTDTAAGFWETKSHRLIRAFSSRTADANAKNAPMSQRGCTPLDTPFVPCGNDRRQADTDKQVCITSKTRNEHGIYQHPNQQGERVG